MNYNQEALHMETNKDMQMEVWINNDKHQDFKGIYRNIFSTHRIY